MIVSDQTGANQRAEREVVVTQETARSWQDAFKVDNLVDLDEESTRSLYHMVQRVTQVDGLPQKSLVRDRDGDLELRREELGDHLFRAMRPEQPSYDMFDPTYSEVDFTVKVMDEQASKDYERLVGDPRNADPSRLEDIAKGAGTVLHSILQPPNLAD